MNKPLAAEWCFAVVSSFLSKEAKTLCWGIAVGIMLVGLYCEFMGRSLQ
jgi:hypothetical protein